MKQLLLVLASFSIVNYDAQTPTKTINEKAIRSNWDRSASSSSPKQMVTINSKLN